MRMSRFLLYLPALACPLLMLVCMAGMRRMGGTSAQRSRAPPPTPPRSRPRQPRPAPMPTRHPPSGYRDRAGHDRPVGAHDEGADAQVARAGFGELEQAIMEVVWSTEGPVTGREVVD